VSVSLNSAVSEETARDNISSFCFRLASNTYLDSEATGTLVEGSRLDHDTELK
jgi:hypothetical protein